MGSIVVMASSVESARKKVQKHFANSSVEWEKTNEWQELIAADMSSEPEVLEDGVFTMFGSS